MAVTAFALKFQTSIHRYAGDNEFLTFELNLNLFKACKMYQYFALNKSSVCLHFDRK